MQIKCLVMNPFQENTYIIYDETRECVIVDAGMYEPAENETIDNFIQENSLKPVKLINTHCHIDHVLGIKYLKEKYNIPFCASTNDNYLIDRAQQHGKIYGFDVEPVPAINENLKDGDFVTFGNSALQVIHVPGHTPGCISFYSRTDNFVVVGDTLFNGSIGRTDLPGGDFQTIIQSIKQKLFALDNNTLVYCGHGETTTIGHERATNYFVKD